MEAVVRDPAWLHHLRSACLTMSGAGLVLAGVVGINLVSGDELLPEDLKADVAATDQAPERVW